MKKRFGDDFLICVDQEGGRVIRFDKPFSQLPPLEELSQCNQSNPDLAKSFAHVHAWLMASELLSIDIDLSFSPVLDIDNGSNVIGDRAFSSCPDEVIELSDYYCRSMHDAGMKTTAAKIHIQVAFHRVTPLAVLFYLGACRVGDGDHQKQRKNDNH